MDDYKTTKIRQMFEKELEKAIFRWRDAKKSGSAVDAIMHLKSVHQAASEVLDLCRQQ